MRLLFLWLTAFFSPFLVAATDWSRLTEDIPFAIPTKTFAEGHILTLPEPVQQQHFQLLRQAFQWVHRYGTAVGGDHAFRWESDREVLQAKELHFYFEDTTPIQMHFPGQEVFPIEAIRRAGIRGAVHLNRGRTCHIYALQYPMDFFLYELPIGKARPFALISAATTIAGQLFGSIQYFLGRRYHLPDAMDSRQRHELNAVQSLLYARNFLLWLQQQPEYGSFTAAERQSIYARIEGMLTQSQYVRYPNPGPKSGCLGQVTDN